LQHYFWFTVEFGLMRGARRGRITVYGSGLLSSYGESLHRVARPSVQRHPLQLEWVINQHVEIDHFQPLLFIVDDFAQLSDQVGTLERWRPEGKLDNVTPGWRDTSEADGESCLRASLEW
jgi:phenylalanine-4-hydroxylase